MAEQDSIPEQQITAPAGEPIVETFKEAVLRLSTAAMAAGYTSKAQLLPYIISQGYLPSHKWHRVLLAHIIRICRKHDNHYRNTRDSSGEQGESVRGDDVSILIDDLRDRARKGDIPAARLYWEIVKSRQSDDEIPQATRDKAAQVVAAAVDELVQGLAPCCADAIRDLVKRITGLAEKK